MELVWVAVILTAIQGIDLAEAHSKVPIDQFAADYLKRERSLWQNIDVQQILIDRGNLLNEVYCEHNRTLHKHIATATIISLLSLEHGKYRQLLDTVRSIESHTATISESLAKGDYARVARLLKNSMAEIERLPETILNAIGDISFWTEIMNNVR